MHTSTKAWHGSGIGICKRDTPALHDACEVHEAHIQAC